MDLKGTSKQDAQTGFLMTLIPIFDKAEVVYKLLKPCGNIKKCEHQE